MNGDAVMRSITPHSDSGVVGEHIAVDAEASGPSSSGGVDLTGFTMFVDRM